MCSSCDFPTHFSETTCPACRLVGILASLRFESKLPLTPSEEKARAAMSQNCQVCKTPSNRLIKNLCFGCYQTVVVDPLRAKRAEALSTLAAIDRDFREALAAAALVSRSETPRFYLCKCGSRFLTDLDRSAHVASHSGDGHRATRYYQIDTLSPNVRKPTDRTPRPGGAAARGIPSAHKAETLDDISFD